MLDGIARRWLDGPLDRAGHWLARRKVTADNMTLVGFILGMACAFSIVIGWDLLALVLLAMGRLADGLDGAIARVVGITDRGGFLDITCDFIFYASVPLAFALRDPAAFALPAAILLAAFYANGSSFLAFSAIAARRAMETSQRGVKSLYFTTGLVEGAETIAFFAAFILFPAWFPILASVFASLCAFTCVARILLGWRLFGKS